MGKMKVLAAVVSACVLCLVLAGCGGGQSSGSASGSAASSASQASSSVAKSNKVTAETIVGDWQLGAADVNGARMTGDLSQMGLSFKLTFKSDNTVTMNMESTMSGTTPTSESISGNWTFENGVAHATFTNESNTTNLDFTANDDGTITTTMEGQGTLTFQRDPSKPEYDIANSKPVTDIASIAGNYTIAGAYMMGICITGDTSAFGMGDTTLVIRADGTADYTTSGHTIAMKLTTANGATTANLEGVECPVTMTGDLLTLDLTSALGGGTQMASFFKKA